MPPAIHTIGHGTRLLPDFLDLLRTYAIDFLVDVRSVPYSTYNPQYRQVTLATALKAAGIRYVYMGDALGGRPADPSCYREDGRIDYEIVRTKDFFQAGLSRIIAAHEKGLHFSLMCSESKPAHCHRSRLIGRALDQEGIPVLHIDENGILRRQQELFHLLF